MTTMPCELTDDAMAWDLSDVLQCRPMQVQQQRVSVKQLVLDSGNPIDS
jgi:hypothetical protein